MQGTIVKGIGGFYYIKSNNEIFECKARGKFRYNDLIPMVGDVVQISEKNGKGVIENIYDRTNQLLRPPVSNVTQAFVVFAFKNPDINIDLLNKFLLLCEYNNINVVICFNKIDMINTEEYRDIIEMIDKSGYEYIFLNAKEGFGIEKLKSKLENNVTVFCGPSGVGKSTILNKLTGRELMETGEVSEKLGRGKHTTRHCELIETSGGFVVDTPGFSSLDMDFLQKENLQFLIPEFSDYIGGCKFTGCLHYKEPKCAVKDAVEENHISAYRYNFYKKTLEEIMNGRARR